MKKKEKKKYRSIFERMTTKARHSIRKGVKITDTEDKDILEVTIQKDFFGLNHDVIILFTYASPINSPYTKSRGGNVLEKLEKKIICNNDNNYIIMGIIMAIRTK